MNCSVLSIDTATNVFELSGINKLGKEVFRERVRREKLIEAVKKVGKCRIVMESSGGTHYWGREFKKLGYEVKLIAPQFVKPFVRGNKTDRSDVLAIGAASRQPGMRFVSVKTVVQQEIQFVHRVRSRYIKSRTAISNEIRGFLKEYGILISRGFSGIRRLPELLENNQEVISGIGQEMFQDLYEEFKALDDKVKMYDKKLNEICKGHPICMELLKVPGIGPVIATILVSVSGNEHDFKNGRGFSAWLGLVPRQNSSGDVRKLGSISKRGNTYVRQLMIHGARAVVKNAHKKVDTLSLWATNLKDKKGFNKAAVAVANKNARIAWVIMAKNKSYDPRLAASH